MLSSYEYTGLTPETAYNFRVTVVDNAGNTNSTGTNVSQTTEAERVVITEADAGKKVNYTPKAGQSYNVDTKYSGYSSSQSFNTSNITGGWSLWGVDDTNIYIIADNTTSNKLTLVYHLGYNNGVTLLDIICDTCFTDKTTYPNMKGQNLKLEQVLAVTTATNANASRYNTTPSSYRYACPYIWNEYEKTQADSQANRSVAYPLTTQTDISPDGSVNPYFTQWSSNEQNTSSAWKGIGYYRMVMTPAQSNVYWLSSRYVQPYEKPLCYFGLQIVNAKGVVDYSLYDELGGNEYSAVAYALRPLVSFPTSIYGLKPNGEAFDIVKKTDNRTELMKKKKVKEKKQ